jgi:hypothetical protein
MTSVLLTLALAFSQAAAVKGDGEKWGAGNFRGLIIGKSTKADMLRRFGKPRWSQTKPEDREEKEREEKERTRDRDQSARRVTWNHYENIGELPGITNIATDTRTGVIVRIDFFPERLTRDEAIARFGPNYLVRRYEFDRCDRDEDHESLYESANGSLLTLEYRSRGVALLIQSNDLVSTIRYVNAPIGSLRSKCQPGGQSRP